MTAWVRSPAWDLGWILSAVWLAPLALLLLHRGGEASLDHAYLALTALFWIGHRAGSVWLAYGTRAYRPLLRSQPVRFLLAPLLIATAVFAVLLPPDDALPFTRMERVIGLVILDYLLVTYHFAAQHFGLLSLYRARGGHARAGRLRLYDRLFALGIGGLLVVLAELMQGAVFHQDLWIEPWMDVAWIEGAAEGLRVGGTVVVCLAALSLLLYETRFGRPTLPRALYVVGMAGMVLVALHAESLFPFLFLWTAQHWIAAVGLTTRASASRRPWLLALGLVAVSVLLLPVMEVEAVEAGGTYYGDRIFGAFAASLRASPLVPALVALGFTTAFLHYLLDRATYRFSDPGVRRAARGLLEP